MWSSLDFVVHATDWPKFDTEYDRGCAFPLRNPILKQTGIQYFLIFNGCLIDVKFVILTKKFTNFHKYPVH